jgi:outer membrane receptor protein involved in Fe transport
MTLAVVLATCTMTMAQSQGRLKGKITDDHGEPVPFANVIVEKGGTQVGGASSDFDGNYDINPIPPGTYDLKASCIGLNPFVLRGLVIPANKITFYDIKMASGAINLNEVTVIDYEIPLISKDNTTSGQSITSEEISKLPVRSAEGVAASVGGVFSSDGEVGSIRGSREGAVYYIDGVKVIGSTSVPQGAIDQVDVILGGTPAMYGDAMGGIINMTTKGPSRTWGGGIEAEYSVDGYGHGRLGGSLQGPLIKSKKNDQEALLGFFLAFDLNRNQYGSTSAVGYYRANDQWMDNIKKNPLTLAGVGSGTYQTAAYTRKDENLFHTRYLNNTTNQSINVTGKIDVRTGKTTNLTLGGSAVLSSGHYAGDRGQYYFNTDKNFLSKSSTYRGYVRFTQRFPSDPEGTSLVSNVYYSIQADYSRYSSESGDPDLWNNIFAYGNIGKFTTYRAPHYSFMPGTVDSVLVDGQYKSFSNVWVLDNMYDTLVQFARPSYDYNPLLAQYVENYYDLYKGYGALGYYDNMSNIVLNNGILNGDSPNRVYSMYAVPGTIQASYGKSVRDQIAVNVNGSLTLGRGDNSHDIKLGFQYEQQNNAQMAYSADYWSLMRDAANFHIRELDLDHPYATSYDGFVDTVNYNRLYDATTQYTFDARLRKAMGLPVDGTEWILIDTYDFDNNTIQYYDANGKLHEPVKVEGGLNLGMFGADELTRDGSLYVNYYGYTYDGSRKYGLTERPSLANFFNDTDADGIFTRPIGAQQPIYMAGYLQDKFAFKDLIFNIGVRVDRFDANQDVLKDPYVLFDYHTVGDLRSGAIHLDDQSTVSIPDNIGDDYAIYVNKISEKTAVVGYRNGNTWYNADGVEISDPNVLDMGTGVSPWVKNKDQQRVDINSFKDYDPAWSVMPRISFSFPISDEALFFAHYDVLTQRPSSAFYCNPLYYYNFKDISGTVANPNLKPMQTIEYELGFTQKVTNTSSLTISGYYHELRNMIQMYRFNGAFPKAYNSYSNLDFGTVKGLTASYDMRRTKNARIRASYTLQFADMTGSSTSTASALIAAGVPNLRSTFPTNADRRHSFNLSLDYRYSKGKNYDGPVIRREGKPDIQILSNTGFNLSVNGGSGTPFTASRTVSSPISGGNNLLQGTYNGSRIPASFRFDLRVDKDFDFTIGKKEGESNGREVSMNVYLQVLNLLNSKNITWVYPATGNPDDDGYLSAPEWQREINSQIDPQAYIQMYSLYVNSGGNYSMPRHIRVGLSFNF